MYELNKTSHTHRFDEVYLEKKKMQLDAKILLLTNVPSKYLSLTTVFEPS